MVPRRHPGDLVGCVECGAERRRGDVLRRWKLGLACGGRERPPRRSLRAWLAAAATIALCAAPRSARAIDLFEIQVYDADIDAPWTPSIELHVNHVASGRREPGYEGETPPNHLTHLTLEPAIGITSFWEAGAYLQLVTEPSGDIQYGGVKLRSKLVLPEPVAGPFDLGVNLEVSWVPRRFEEASWGTEIRPILGYRLGPWRLDVNPILSFGLRGPREGVPDFEPAGKLRYDTGLHFGIGPEYYAGLGPIDGLLPLREQEHVIYAAADAIDLPFELNLGVGRGLTGASNEWTLKAIIGRSF